MSTHTPGKWATLAQAPYDKDKGVPIVDGDGFRIAWVNVNTETFKDAKHLELAAYIVRACNAHEELVTALKIAVPELVAYYGKYHFAVNVCRYAIAKAEGRA